MKKATGLIRFWFKFKDEENSTIDPVSYWGCGVSAYSLEDALSIMKGTLFAGKKMPDIVSVTEDVDIRTLDINHVRPNMGIVTKRGIWFPQGF